jgi:hypothetical protein
MAKTIAQNFASMLQSAAELIRAADGAKMPARAPTSPAARNGAAALAVGSGDEDDDGDDDEPRGDWAEVVKQLMPLVQLAVSSYVGKKPGGGNGRPALEAARTAGDAAANGNGSPAKAERPVVKDAFAQMKAIEALLAPDELVLVRRAIEAMTPEVAHVWGQRLCDLTAEEAAEVVRAEIQKVKENAA